MKNMKFSKALLITTFDGNLFIHYFHDKNGLFLWNIKIAKNGLWHQYKGVVKVSIYQNKL